MVFRRIWRKPVWATELSPNGLTSGRNQGLIGSCCRTRSQTYALLLRCQLCKTLFVQWQCVSENRMFRHRTDPLSLCAFAIAMLLGQQNTVNGLDCFWFPRTPVFYCSQRSLSAVPGDLRARCPDDATDRFCCALIHWNNKLISAKAWKICEHGRQPPERKIHEMSRFFEFPDAQ